MYYIEAEIKPHRKILPEILAMRQGGKTMTDMQFGECIRRMRDGDRQGLADIYGEYYKLVYSAALSVTGNRQDAEDAVSDYFVKLWVGISSGRINFDSKRTGHKSWLSVSAKNLAADMMRKLRRADLTEEIPEEDAPTGNTEDEITERIGIAEAFNSLEEPEREAVHLKYFGGYTLKEIADIMSVPQGTAAWRFRTGTDKLKKMIGEAFGNEK